jgi:YggT family protein
MFALGYPLLALVKVADTLLFICTILVIASAVISWVNADPHNRIVYTIRSLTEPLYARLRPFMPSIGVIDLAPIALLLIISLIRAGILPIFAHIGNSML